MGALFQIKILQPEHLKNSVRRFVAEKMGNEYSLQTGLNLQESYEESNARTPLILIHPHGKLPRRGSLKGTPGWVR